MQQAFVLVGNMLGMRFIAKIICYNNNIAFFYGHPNAMQALETSVLLGGGWLVVLCGSVGGLLTFTRIRNSLTMGFGILNPATPA